jgi:hypothetical protein
MSDEFVALARYEAILGADPEVSCDLWLLALLVLPTPPQPQHLLLQEETP